MRERLTSPLHVMLAAWRRLRPLCGDGVGPMVVLVAASVCAGLAEAGVLALVADVAATMVTHGHRLTSGLGPLSAHTSLGLALFVAFGLAAVRLLLQVAIAWLPARISAEVQGRLRRDLFDAFSQASWAVQSQQREGHLQELITNQVNQVTQVAVQVFGALSGGAMFLALVAAALFLNALVAFIICAFAIVLFWVLRPIAQLGGRAAAQLSQASMDQAAGVSEAVRLAEEAHVFGAVSASRKRIGRLVDIAQNAVFRYMLMGGLASGIYQGLVIVFIVGGLAGLYVTGAGHVAALGAVVLMLVRASSYAQQFQGGYQALIQVVPYIDRLQRTTSMYRDAVTPSGSQTLQGIETLALDNVTFSYRDARPVLRGVSFEVHVGEAIGIVGPSGAGKSTLVQILLHLREPDSGAYLINGQPVSSFNRADWQRRVAYVAQEPRIMHATVAENICFFRSLEQAAVEQAARLAHIHDDILRLPAGYDTVIGQVADALSGGQRQRVCLARALANNPDILVLDEPTSALDMASEVAVQASLTALHGRLTLFVVAHRMSTISKADRLIVLADGTLEAFAPPYALERTNAFYRTATALALQRPSDETDTGRWISA
jgi:ATP-binding cassette subfamily B protein